MGFLAGRWREKGHRTTKGAKLCLLVMLLVLGEPLLLAAAAAKTISEDQLPSLHAALVLKIGMFVVWPDQAPDYQDEHIPVAVIGDDAVFDAFQRLADKTIHGRQLVLIRYRPGEEIQPHRIIFVAADGGPGAPTVDQSDDLSRSWISAAWPGVLTIGADPDFNARGGMIQLSIEGGRPRFSINLAAAEAAGITFSSKLLKIATIYQEEIK